MPPGGAAFCVFVDFTLTSEYYSRRVFRNISQNRRRNMMCIKPWVVALASCLILMVLFVVLFVRVDIPPSPDTGHAIEAARAIHNKGARYPSERR